MLHDGPVWFSIYKKQGRALLLCTESGTTVGQEPISNKSPTSDPARRTILNAEPRISIYIERSLFSLLLEEKKVNGQFIQGS